MILSMHVELPLLPACRFLQEGLSAVLGDVRSQLALSLSSLLPWLCVHFRGSPHSSLAAVCIAVMLSLSFILTQTDSLDRLPIHVHFVHCHFLLLFISLAYVSQQKRDRLECQQN